MPRVQKPSKPRHDPLHAQLAEDEVEARYGRISQPGKRKKSKRSTDDEDGAEVRSILLLGPGLSEPLCPGHFGSENVTKSI